MHADLAHELLAQKVADFDEGAGLGDGAVDGEMGVDGAHLVLVALNNRGLSRICLPLHLTLSYIFLRHLSLFTKQFVLQYARQ